MPNRVGCHIFTRDPNCNGASNPNTGEILALGQANGHSTHCDQEGKALQIPMAEMAEITVSKNNHTNNSTRDRWSDDKHRHRTKAWVYGGFRYLEHTVWVRTVPGTTTKRTIVRFVTDIKNKTWEVKHIKS